jgi:hypothetical protein
VAQQRSFEHTHAINVPTSSNDIKNSPTIVNANVDVTTPRINRTMKDDVESSGDDEEDEGDGDVSTDDTENVPNVLDNLDSSDFNPMG